MRNDLKAKQRQFVFDPQRGVDTVGDGGALVYIARVCIHASQVSWFIIDIYTC